MENKNTSYKLFGLIKDVYTNVQTKKVRRIDVLVIDKHKTVRHVFGIFNYVISEGANSYTIEKTIKK